MRRSTGRAWLHGPRLPAKGDLSVDWTSRESREAAVRVKIKRLLRKHKYLYLPPPPRAGEGPVAT